MNTTKNMAKEVTEWAKGNENVRAVILTSTRANPSVPIDTLSDYDIELFVEDLQPFLEGDEWLRIFGEVLVREPYKPVIGDENDVWRLVIFKDVPRIDFHIMLSEAMEEDSREHGGYTNDMGYQVLLDKDGLAEGAVSPTYTQYLTKQPTEGEYEELVHHFWWNITYVAKYLFRDELFFAKYMLDDSLHHHYLRTAIAWYIGMQNSWKSNPGAFGRWFKKQVESDLWSDIEATFAGADLEENWNAMFKTAEVFGRLASKVGEHLGCAYPLELDRNVTEYLREIRRMSDNPGGDFR